jgi:hypothetical protein
VTFVTSIAFLGPNLSIAYKVEVKKNQMAK